MVEIWDKLSKLFGHMATKRQAATGHDFDPDYYNFTEYVPANVAQRRTHLRIDLFLPLTFWRIIRKVEGAQLSDEAVKKGEFDRIPTAGGMGLNLSGTGVLIISSEEFNNGDYIEISDRLFGRQMNIYGQVKRSLMTKFDNTNICEFAVQFIKIKDSDREFIVKAIFDKVKILRKINEDSGR